METIIVGTDFSVPANNAVIYAGELARYFSARLILVNSYSLPLGASDSMTSLHMISELRDHSLQKLEALKKEMILKSYDFGIDCIAELGSPTEVITSVAEQNSADLIVMGMIGEGSFLKRNFLGSSALSVSRNSEIPLFIVPEAVKYHRIHQICFACDLENIEENTLLYTAKYFAAVFDAEIELVTVKKAGKEVILEKPEIHAFVEERLQNIPHKSVYIKDDSSARALEYYFRFHKTDLVMINPRKHNFFKSLFSESVTKHLAFSVEVPLLIIH